MLNRIMKTSSSIFFMLVSSMSLAAETMVLESGHKQNTLVELYTSEGCSSCPPAEKYLNSLKGNNELWKNIFPIAFHVDYWDYIGWKDQYAQKEFGYRQSSYASLKRASTVYTPAFMVNGASWRRGIFSSSLPTSQSLPGNLKVSIDGKIVRASYQPRKKNNQPLKINIAVLGMGLSSNITRGENAGRSASHEFVVVGFNDKVSTNLMWETKLPKLHYQKAKKYALAVWVSEINNPTPLQVVGNFLPNYKR